MKLKVDGFDIEVGEVAKVEIEVERAKKPILTDVHTIYIVHKTNRVLLIEDYE